MCDKFKSLALLKTHWVIDIRINGFGATFILKYNISLIILDKLKYLKFPTPNWNSNNYLLIYRGQAASKSVYSEVVYVMIVLDVAEKVKEGRCIPLTETIMKTQWITYKGKRILLVDCSNFIFQTDQIKAELDMAVLLASKEPPNSILILSDVRGSKMSPEIFKITKEATSKIAYYARKRAMVGVTTVQKIFLESLNALFPKKQITTFDDIEKAKEWLVS